MFSTSNTYTQNLIIKRQNKNKNTLSVFHVGTYILTLTYFCNCQNYFVLLSTKTKTKLSYLRTLFLDTFVFESKIIYLEKNIQIIILYLYFKSAITLTNEMQRSKFAFSLKYRITSFVKVFLKLHVNIGVIAHWGGRAVSASNTTVVVRKYPGVFTRNDYVLAYVCCICTYIYACNLRTLVT